MWDLAASFFRRPDLANSADPVADALKFKGQIEDGVDASAHYRGIGSQYMNDFLRGHGPIGFQDELERILRETEGTRIQRHGGFAPYGPDNTDRSISDLSRVLGHSSLPADMSLSRGMDRRGLEYLESLLGVHPSDPAAAGRSFIDPGFLSTTFDNEIAHNFAMLPSDYVPGAAADRSAGAVFNFPKVPKGKSGLFINPGESEVIFPPGRRIQINDNSNFPYIKASLYSSLLAAMGAGSANAYQHNFSQPTVN